MRDEVTRRELLSLDEALTTTRPLGNPPQLWKTLDALGQLRVAQSRPQDAGLYHAEAAAVRQETAARMGDHPLARKLASS